MNPAKIFTLLLAAQAFACNGADQDASSPASSAASPPTPESSAAELAFRDAVNPPPAGWSGPRFELSHDYPSALPSGPSTSQAPWLSRDVDFNSSSPPVWTEGWDDYMNDLLVYVSEGQDPDLANHIGWRTEVGGSTRWFHVPWMAYDDYVGREFIHGLTNERSAHLPDLIGKTLRGSAAHVPVGNSATETAYETWSVGFYNDFGGYSIGQVVPSDGVPRATAADPAPRPPGLPFAEGSFVAKALFTAATPDVVPFLEGSPVWVANRHIKTGDTPRRPADVRLLQLDVAVRDARSPTNWVYGTFVYNGNLSGDTVWERLSPLGLQWGSDPNSSPAVAKADSRPLSQSVIAPIDIFEHEGAKGRLAGPADNQNSSCMSCHQGAFAASPVGTLGKQGSNIPPIFSFNDQGQKFNPQNAAYFQNILFPDAYPGGDYDSAIPLDTSLQLQVTFNEYAAFLAASGN